MRKSAWPTLLVLLLFLTASLPHIPGQQSGRDATQLPGTLGALKLEKSVELDGRIVDAEMSTSGRSPLLLILVKSGRIYSYSVNLESEEPSIHQVASRTINVERADGIIAVGQYILVYSRITGVAKLLNPQTLEVLRSVPLAGPPSIVKGYNDTHIVYCYNNIVFLRSTISNDEELVYGPSTDIVKELLVDEAGTIYIVQDDRITVVGPSSFSEEHYVLPTPYTSIIETHHGLALAHHDTVIYLAINHNTLETVATRKLNETIVNMYRLENGELLVELGNGRLFILTDLGTPKQLPGRAYQKLADAFSIGTSILALYYSGIARIFWMPPAAFSTVRMVPSDTQVLDIAGNNSVIVRTSRNIIQVIDSSNKTSNIPINVTLYLGHINGTLLLADLTERHPRLYASTLNGEIIAERAVDIEGAKVKYDGYIIAWNESFFEAFSAFLTPILPPTPAPQGKLHSAGTLSDGHLWIQCADTNGRYTVYEVDLTPPNGSPTFTPIFRSNSPITGARRVGSDYLIILDHTIIRMSRELEIKEVKEYPEPILSLYNRSAAEPIEHFASSGSNIIWLTPTGSQVYSTPAGGKVLFIDYNRLVYLLLEGEIVLSPLTSLPHYSDIILVKRTEVAYKGADGGKYGYIASYESGFVEIYVKNRSTTSSLEVKPYAFIAMILEEKGAPLYLLYNGFHLYIFRFGPGGPAELVYYSESSVSSMYYEKTSKTLFMGGPTGRFIQISLEKDVKLVAQLGVFIEEVLGSDEGVILASNNVIYRKSLGSTTTEPILRFNATIKHVSYDRYTRVLAVVYEARNARFPGGQVLGLYGFWGDEPTKLWSLQISDRIVGLSCSEGYVFVVLYNGTFLRLSMIGSHLEISRETLGRVIQNSWIGPDHLLLRTRSGGGQYFLDYYTLPRKGLYVTSVPSGAHVYLDGKYMGTTPLYVQSLTEGTHTLRVELGGWEPWSKTLHYTGGFLEEVAFLTPRREAIRLVLDGTVISIGPLIGEMDISLSPSLDMEYTRLYVMPYEVYIDGERASSGALSVGVNKTINIHLEKKDKSEITVKVYASPLRRSSPLEFGFRITYAKSVPEKPENQTWLQVSWPNGTYTILKVPLRKAILTGSYQLKIRGATLSLHAARNYTCIQKYAALSTRFHIGQDPVKDRLDSYWLLDLVKTFYPDQYGLVETLAKAAAIYLQSINREASADLLSSMVLILLNKASAGIYDKPEPYAALLYLDPRNLGLGCYLAEDGLIIFYSITDGQVYATSSLDTKTVDVYKVYLKALALLGSPYNLLHLVTQKLGENTLAITSGTILSPGNRIETHNATILLDDDISASIIKVSSPQKLLVTVRTGQVELKIEKPAIITMNAKYIGSTGTLDVRNMSIECPANTSVVIPLSSVSLLKNGKLYLTVRLDAYEYTLTLAENTIETIKPFQTNTQQAGTLKSVEDEYMEHSKRFLYFIVIILVIISIILVFAVFEKIKYKYNYSIG